MTVPATPNIQRHAGNDTTGPWAYPYRYLDNAHLKFIYRLADGTEGEYVQGVDYSISSGGPNDPTGCVLTTTAAVATGVALAIYADTPAEQNITPDTLRTFREQAFEQALDALAIQNRRVSSDVDRALVRSPLDPGGQFTLNNLTPGYVITIQDADTLRGDEILAADVGNAQGYAEAAGLSAVATAASEDKANKWAEEDEDVPVEPGEFSAYHWAQKAAQNVNSGMIVQADKPGTPSANAVWFQTRTGKSYLWYNDATTTQWVQFNHDKAASVAQSAIVFPPTPAVDDTFTPNAGVGVVTYRCVSISPAQWDIEPDTDIELQVAQNVVDIQTNSDDIVVNANAIAALAAQVNWTYPTPFTAETGVTGLEFTSIPSTVNEIVVGLKGASCSGTDNLQVQLGAGSWLTTGYDTGSFNTTAAAAGAAGFVLGLALATRAFAGLIYFKRFGNHWYCALGGPTTNNVIAGGGYVDLAGVLDRLRLVPTGSDTFDVTRFEIGYR